MPNTEDSNFFLFKNTLKLYLFTGNSGVDLMEVGGKLAFAFSSWQWKP